jgi:hypothetical protein
MFASIHGIILVVSRWGSLCSPQPRRATAKDYYKEWNDLGMPNPRDKERGVVDPDILEWLIPWWLTPSPLACPKGEPGCPCE